MALDESRTIIRILWGLSPRYREAIVFRYWLDLSELQMARSMNVSKGSVKAHLSRGLAAMRRAPAEEKLIDG